MTQTNKIFNFLNTFMLIIFFIEMLILFLNIDIIPLLLIGVVCGLIIIIRNSNDDFFYGSTEVLKGLYYMPDHCSICQEEEVRNK